MAIRDNGESGPLLLRILRSAINTIVKGRVGGPAKLSSSSEGQRYFTYAVVRSSKRNLFKALAISFARALHKRYIWNLKLRH